MFDDNGTAGNLTDDTENSLTHETKNYHIFGFHTLGKQYIESNIFGINKSYTTNLKNTLYIHYLSKYLDLNNLFAKVIATQNIP